MMLRTIEGPRGLFVIPGEPADRSRYSETCVRHVFEGEYNYERDRVEDVASIVDVGCNVGSFILWATQVWWPGRIQSIRAYDPNSAALTIAKINTVGLPVMLHPYAVTSAEPPVFFKEHIDWGGSRTCGEWSGIEVPSLHPRDLPAADVLKVDAEGVDPEVFEHYQHWDRVKVAMFEYHEEKDREPMMAACERAGLTMVRHHGSPPRQGIQIWVRR